MPPRGNRSFARRQSTTLRCCRALRESIRKTPGQDSLRPRFYRAHSAPKQPRQQLPRADRACRTILVRARRCNVKPRACDHRRFRGGFKRSASPVGKGSCYGCSNEGATRGSSPASDRCRGSIRVRPESRERGLAGERVGPARRGGAECTFSGTLARLATAIAPGAGSRPEPRVRGSGRGRCCDRGDRGTVRRACLSLHQIVGICDFD